MCARSVSSLSAWRLSTCRSNHVPCADTCTLPQTIRTTESVGLDSCEEGSLLSHERTLHDKCVVFFFAVPCFVLPAVEQRKDCSTASSAFLGRWLSVGFLAEARPV